MKVKIENEGDNPVRVVIDHDTVNDVTLDAGATELFVADDEGVIELRELGGGVGEEDEDEAEPRSGR